MDSTGALLSCGVSSGFDSGSVSLAGALVGFDSGSDSTGPGFNEHHGLFLPGGSRFGSLAAEDGFSDSTG